MSKERYEKIYSEQESVFGLEPHPAIKKIPDYVSLGKVVDLGAGEGRNSLFLAEKGFEVTAIDNAGAAVEKMNKLSEEKGVKLHALEGDARTVEIPEGQDVVLAILLFHHLSRTEALAIIEKMKAATRPGGLNVLAAVTKDSDFYRQNPKIDKFYAESDELKDLYQDWEILESDTRRWQAHQKRADGSAMLNTSEEITARKPEDRGNLK